MLIETYQFQAFLLDGNVLTKHLLEVLSLSAEFHHLPDRGQKDIACLAKLEKVMKGDDMMVKKPLHKVHTKRMFERFPSSAKVNVLLHAHVHRLTEELTPALREDLIERVLPQVSGGPTHTPQ